MRINRPIDDEIRRRVRAGYLLSHQDERTASLSRPRKARSGILFILLLLLGIVPGIVYLLLPRRADSVLLTRIDERSTEVVGDRWTAGRWFASLRLRTKVLIVAGAVVVVALASVSGSGNDTSGGPPLDASGSNAPNAAADESSSSVTATTGDASTSCITVSRSLLDDLEHGLTVTGGGSLRDGVAVRSQDHENVWYLAAEIDGEGMNESGDVGVWATSRNPTTNSPGLLFAVDAFAQEFSDWGSGPPETFSSGDRGVRSARDCLR